MYKWSSTKWLRIKPCWQHLVLLLAIVYAWPVPAKEFCANLVGEYEFRQDSVGGGTKAVVDFSAFLGATGRLKTTQIHRILSMKSIFKDFREEIFVNFTYDGHVAVVAGGKRFDARLAYLKKIGIEDSRSTIEAGVMIRLRPESSEFVPAMLQAMEGMSGKKTLTCAAGACSLAQRAGLDIPTFIKPSKLLEHILREGLTWRGEKVEYDVFATTEIGNLQTYLRQLDRAPMTIGWNVLRLAALQGKRVSFGAIGLVQKNVVQPTVAFFLYPFRSSAESQEK